MSLLGSTSPIGLDVSSRTVAAAQLSSTRAQWRLERTCIVPRPAGVPADALSIPEAERLADILSRQGFSGRDVILAVPDRKLMLTVLDLPPRDSGAPIHDLARAEMARAHRRTPDSFEMASWDLPAPTRGAEGTHLMAAACAHADAAALLDPVEAAGLSVAALDLRAWAMARACERPLSGSTDVSGLLDLGESGATLALVRAGVVIYERALPDAGLAPLRASFTEALSIEPDAAEAVFAQLTSPESAELEELPAEAVAALAEHTQLIVRELRTALTYAIHRYGGEVASVLLHGCGAGLRGLAERLSAELGAPALPARPSDLLSCASGVASGDPALSLAIGLARHDFRRAA